MCLEHENTDGPHGADRRCGFGQHRELLLDALIRFGIAHSAMWQNPSCQGFRHVCKHRQHQAHIAKI
ncbi:hypothetical protein, partial [Burkholderia thailandensis]|uniref:hypothetical protein n=1 Tax=Burkholderia thailandensis TaxID=57975 RepID=UPI001E565215